MNEPPIQYSMLIEWSEEDQAYLVTLPEWASQVYMPVTHGAGKWAQSSDANAGSRALCPNIESKMRGLKLRHDFH